jgi:L-threonylcarbamoyladenylate synthase
MKTILTTSPQLASQFIKNGGLVAFPTETVYGLGADVFNETAIRKIFAAKQRPADNPLIAHVGKTSDIQLLAAEVNETAQRFIEVFFPSPLTLVLPKREEVPLIATANLDTIGVRMPKHELAREFIRYCGTPVVAPSANLSGKPSPTTWQAVLTDLDSRIDCILQGEQTAVGLESTVVDCTEKIPVVLRLGAITLEDLQKIEPNIRLLDDYSKQKLRSPGLRHKHYAPQAKVILIDDVKDLEAQEKSAFIGLNAPTVSANLAEIKVCANIEIYARELFNFFRQCDEKKITAIFCQTVEETGLGRALMDRLKRAAE